MTHDIENIDLQYSQKGGSIGVKGWGLGSEGTPEIKINIDPPPPKMPVRVMYNYITQGPWLSLKGPADL